MAIEDTQQLAVLGTIAEVLAEIEDEVDDLRVTGAVEQMMQDAWATGIISALGIAPSGVWYGLATVTSPDVGKTIETDGSNPLHVVRTAIEEARKRYQNGGSDGNQ